MMYAQVPTVPKVLILSLFAKEVVGEQATSQSAKSVRFAVAVIVSPAR
jgi:hypothetical protein